MDVLDVWVIYGSPSDYPGKYVLRRQVVGTGGTITIDAEPTGVVHTLDQARALVPPGLVRMDRQPEDDPSIMETWI